MNQDNLKYMFHFGSAQGGFMIAPAPCLPRVLRAVALLITELLLFPPYTFASAISLRCAKLSSSADGALTIGGTTFGREGAALVDANADIIDPRDPRQRALSVSVGAAELKLAYFAELGTLRVREDGGGGSEGGGGRDTAAGNTCIRTCIKVASSATTRGTDATVLGISVAAARVATAAGCFSCLSCRWNVCIRRELGELDSSISLPSSTVDNACWRNI